MARRSRSPTVATSANLFNHRQRNHQIQYTAVLPITSFAPFSDSNGKVIHMAAANKSTKRTTTSSPMVADFRYKMPLSDTNSTKARIISAHRTTISNMPKSSLSYPTTIRYSTTSSRSTHLQHHHNYQQPPPPPPQQQQHNEKLVYVVKTPSTSRRVHSARIAASTSWNSSIPQQQSNLLTSQLLPRPHPQYGHFLAYLRRQSLARIRRKQEQEAGNTENVEATIKYNPIKSTTQSLQSASNTSIGMSSPEIASLPTMSLASKRLSRPRSSYHSQQHSSLSLHMNYRLNLNPSSSPTSPISASTKLNINNHVLVPSVPTSTVATPRNSVVGELTKLPTAQAPYELELSGNVLNYCYVSDSGVKYQGQLLSTSV